MEVAQAGAALGQDRHQGKLHALDAEQAKVEAGIDRYLRAFETGAMPETLCGERVKALGRQSSALRARREQLADEMEDADVIAPTPEELSVLRERVAEAVAHGSAGPVKSLLQAQIHEIRVDSRQAIHPTFRVPLGGGHHPDDAVRAPSRSVEPTRRLGFPNLRSSDATASADLRGAAAQRGLWIFGPNTVRSQLIN